MNEPRPQTGTTSDSRMQSLHVSLSGQPNTSIRNRVTIQIDYNEVILEQNDKSSLNQVTEQEILPFSQLVDNLRLDEQFYQFRKSAQSKCSCVGFSSNISQIDQVKKEFQHTGSQKYNPQDEVHKNTVYSILFYLNNCNNLNNQSQINRLTKNDTNFFQLMQFLSCLEFETNSFQKIYKEYGDNFFDLVKMIGQIVFEQLYSKKLDQLINLQKQNQLHNILRNYQNAIIYYLFKEQQKNYKFYEEKLKSIKNIDPQKLYNEYLNDKKNNRIISFD